MSLTKEDKIVQLLVNHELTCVFEQGEEKLRNDPNRVDRQHQCKAVVAHV
jgi:hypothetical protein